MGAADAMFGRQRSVCVARSIMAAWRQRTRRRTRQRTRRRTRCFPVGSSHAGPRHPEGKRANSET